jgi:hypothetical protein
MNLPSDVATSQTNPHARVVKTRPRGSFYTWVAVGAALIVFAGFARTYYLKELFGTRTLPLLLHVHGLVMTSWFVLFFVQVRLVAARRIDLHRRLGVIGALLALCVVVVGATTIIVRAKPHFRPGHSLAVLAFQLSVLLVFAVLAAGALLLRRRRDFHKRLMLLASVSILMPAIVRIPLSFIQKNVLVGFGLIDLCVLAPVVFDTIKNRRLHPAFGWGALLIVASQPLSFLLGAAHVWTRFATWLLT